MQEVLCLALKLAVLARFEEQKSENAKGPFFSCIVSIPEHAQLKVERRTNSKRTEPL